jgi:hypothetical protein
MSNTASGPEYLATLADQAAANNDSPIADQLRELSRQWKADQQQLQAAFDDNSQLQARLNNVAKAVAA